MPKEISPPAQEDEESPSLYLFILPSQEPLGINDTDFSKVVIKSIRVSDGQTTDIDRNKVFISCRGKLSTLTRGLLHIADVRARVTKEQVQQTFVETAQKNLQKKRRGIGTWGYSIC